MLSMSLACVATFGHLHELTCGVDIPDDVQARQVVHESRGINRSFAAKCCGGYPACRVRSWSDTGARGGPTLSRVS